MYKIIGADQKEYGPVTSDQIRHWIGENRVNAQTQARAEGEQEWKPLGSFAEFSDLLGAVAAPPPVTAATPAVASGRDAALQAVKGPAIALLVTAILNLLLAIWQFIKIVILRSGMELYSGMPQFNDPQFQKMLQMLYGPIGAISAIFALVMSGLVLVGALRMLSLRNYVLALIGSIVAMVPCATPCCLIGLPFGIWALVVLTKDEVKSHFT